MKVLLAGDSTVAAYSQEFAPMMGWGEALAAQLGDTADVINFAKPGSTTRSFVEEGLFEQLLEKVDAEALVLFQFGHNDQNPANGVKLNEYYARLQRMIAEVKAKEGQPILCTPVERRVDGDGRSGQTLTDFLPICRRLAEEAEIPLFDLNRYSFYLYREHGLEGAKQLFMWLGRGEQANYPMGSVDDTHFRGEGAHEIARYVKIRLQEFLRKGPLFKKHYYGACMYPEVWSREIFEHDVAHMQEIGMNFARFGEFAWKTIESDEGCFDLSLLERALDTYQKHSIDVCLCIPTPTPPRWFTRKYPGSLVKNADGTLMEHGSRQHVCTNNEDFRRYAYRMTRKVANLADKYPNVIAIQLDNEFKCHVDLCYCDSCRTRWHQYLKEAYGTVGNLNEKWGTQVWSEAYDSFEEVVLPTRTPFLHNSSLMNAFRKFTALTLNEFAHDLCHFVRMETDVPITHNSAFGFNLMNDHLFADLDVAGFDTYPSADNYPAFLLNVDRWRNVRKHSNEALLLETTPSHTGHLENHVAPHPAGFITAEMFIGFAGNLKSFSYWHYRSHRHGVEQPHSAVVTAWGEPDLGYEDVVRSGNLAQEMQPHLLASEYRKAKIAFMYSDHAKRFFTIDHGGCQDHRGLVTDYYSSLIKAGIRLEVIQENSDYTGYEVLIVPFVRWISATVLEKLQAFVAAGGKLILGPMTGDRTEELAWPERNGLDRIGEWLDFNGIRQFSVKNLAYPGIYQGMQENMDRLVTTFQCPEGWQILMAGPGGKALAARRPLGNGEIIYLGALPQDLNGSRLWKSFIAEEIKPYEMDRHLLSVAEGIVKYRRETPDHVQLYLTNMARTESEFTLLQEATNLLTGKLYTKGTHCLDSYGYSILAFTQATEVAL